MFWQLLVCSAYSCLILKFVFISRECFGHRAMLMASAILTRSELKPTISGLHTNKQNKIHRQWPSTYKQTNKSEGSGQTQMSSGQIQKAVAKQKQTVADLWELLYAPGACEFNAC